jgi:hypothetical protein
MEKYIDAPNTSGEILAARDICAACPITTRRACAGWVLANESPPGSWYGMYAGMTPRERRALVKSQRRKAA